MACPHTGQALNAEHPPPQSRLRNAQTCPSLPFPLGLYPDGSPMPRRQMSLNHHNRYIQSSNSSGWGCLYAVCIGYLPETNPAGRCADTTCMPQRRVAPQTAASLDQIGDELESQLKKIREAARLLRSVPGSTAEVTGSRGLYGTPGHPGAIPMVRTFAEDAEKKAQALAREYQRRRRG
jgi:hypothetical protein